MFVKLSVGSVIWCHQVLVFVSALRVLLFYQTGLLTAYKTIDNYAGICGFVLTLLLSLNTAMEDNKFQDER